MFFPLHDANPTMRPALLTGALIALCVGVFVFWQLAVGLDQSVFQAGLMPALSGVFGTATATDLAALAPPNFPTTALDSNLGLSAFISHMFMHGGWAHLLFNMYFLWMFGDNVEDRLGALPFLVFFVLTGLVAALAHIVATGPSVIPMVGASGAISGVMGAYAAMYPKAKVKCLLQGQIIFIPAWLLIAFWFARDVVMFMTNSGGNVANMAHIGGFVAGFVLIWFFPKRNYPAPAQLTRGPWR